MPVHDWTRVDAGIFHHFHLLWLAEISNALNGGLLPPEFYALTEQHAGRRIADVLTLHVQPPSGGSSGNGGVAVAEAPPKVRRRITASSTLRSRRRTLAIRHVSGHRIVALLEVVSPSNKDRVAHVTEFAKKVEDALRNGIHVIVADLFPPSTHDPQGMHGAIWQMIDDAEEDYDLPADEPLTLASYVADVPVEAYLEHLGVGAPLPDMPLFFESEHYVNVPLDNSYHAAFQGVPAYWREVLERQP